MDKIADLMEVLIAKTRSWEEERNKVFLYDEVRSATIYDITAQCS